uniref:CcmFII n=1 Tax=Urostyla grandis TaxID=57509 RepID=A0A2I4PFM1_9SPIT|nr:CcmFII [Urostyla grandis]
MTYFMLFKHFYTWIKFKTLPPSFLFKNRLFVERDSKRTRVFNNVGLTFRNERWTNWEALHFDWKWIDLFILMSRYLGGFLFLLFVWKFWGNYLIELPVFNKVALKLWLIHDFFNYYSLYAVWVFILMRSFIWDTFIVVLFSGSAKHYYPLARREEALRREANQMRRVVKEIRTDIPEFLNDPKMLLWTVLSSQYNQRLIPLVSAIKSQEVPCELIDIARTTYKLSYLLSMSSISVPMLRGELTHLPPSLLRISPLFRLYSNNFQRRSLNTTPPSLVPITLIDDQYSSFNVSLHSRGLSYLAADDLLVSLFGTYSQQFLNMARQQRLFSASLIPAPTAHISSIRTSCLKSFLSTTNSWGSPSDRNIWAKSVNGVVIKNLLTPIFSFEQNQSVPLPTFINIASSSPSLQTQFDLESSLGWLIQRGNMFKDVYVTHSQPIAPTAITLSSLSANQISNDSVNRTFNGVLPVKTLTIWSVKSVKARTSPLSPISYENELNENWSLWSEETSRDLAELYLTTWLDKRAIVLNTPHSSTSNRIYFRK